MSTTMDEQRIARRQFVLWLSSLRKGTAADLKELFRQFSEEENEAVRQEICQTIQEIMFPECMNVDFQDEFQLTHEDSFVREKLTAYRRKVGDEIKRQRKAAGLSQVELAEMAGISQSHLCRLETGVHVPENATIERIATALKTSPATLDPGFSEG